MEKVIDNIIIRYGKILAEKFTESYKAGFKRLQIRQTISKGYPAQAVSNGFSDDLFSLGSQEDYTWYDSDRVAWIMLPDSVSLEQAQAELDKHTEAVIYRKLSMKPVLTQQQRYGISSGLSSKTEEDYANDQMVLDKDGNPVTYKTRPFYSIKAFSKEYRPDEDMRDKQLSVNLVKEPVANVPAPDPATKPIELVADEAESTDDLPF